MNPYEMTFIVRPDLDEEQTHAAVDSVTGRITSLGGEVIATYPWNPPRRRLAYSIKDFGDGFYITTVFRFPTEGLKDFERGLRLNTGVLRFLLLQATETNIQQGQQRAQQAAARAAAPPLPAAPQPAPVSAEVQAAPVETATPAPEPETQAEPVATETASDEAAPSIEEIASAPEAEAEPEPVAAAPAGDEEE